MGIITNVHHSNQALRFHAATMKYIGIGGTAAWPNENNPPAENPAATVINTPICYKPVAVLKLYKLDVAGLFEWPAGSAQKWTEVAPNNAIAQGATHVYVETNFNRDEAPLVTFREVGLFMGLVLATGAPAGVVLPNQVTSPGVLEAFDNRPPTQRYIDKVDTVSLMFAF